LSLIERATVKYSVLADCTSRPIPEGGGGSMGPATSEAVEWGEICAPPTRTKYCCAITALQGASSMVAPTRESIFFMVLSPPKYHMPDARTC